MRLSCCHRARLATVAAQLQTLFPFLFFFSRIRERKMQYELLYFKATWLISQSRWSLLCPGFLFCFCFYSLKRTCLYAQRRRTRATTQSRSYRSTISVKKSGRGGGAEEQTAAIVCQMLLKNTSFNNHFVKSLIHLLTPISPFNAIEKKKKEKTNKQTTTTASVKHHAKQQQRKKGGGKERGRISQHTHKKKKRKLA